MKSPLKVTIVTTPFGTVGSGWTFGRHMGVDLRARTPLAVYAPSAGVINEVYTGASGAKIVGLDDGKYFHRFLHLSRFSATVGERVDQGEIIGYTGSTGATSAHLHWDVRKRNTKWNTSFSNYYDPMKLIEGEEDVKTTREDAIRAERIITMKHTPSETKIKAATNRELSPYLEDRYNDGDFLANKEIVTTKYPAALKEIAALKAGTTKQAVLDYLDQHLS